VHVLFFASFTSVWEGQTWAWDHQPAPCRAGYWALLDEFTNQKFCCVVVLPVLPTNIKQRIYIRPDF